MLLAIDAGNTDTVVGLFDGAELLDEAEDTVQLLLQRAEFAIRRRQRFRDVQVAQLGAEWRAVGKPIDETSALARAMAIGGKVIVIATDRGVFRSADGGERWEPPRESLPAHVAARVLVGDARNPASLYAGFALTGYEELQQQVRRETASWRSGLGSVGEFGLVVLIALGVVAAAARHLGKLRAKVR